MISKENLRKEILAKREKLDAQTHHNLSQQIQDRLLKNQTWRQAEKIALYSSTRGEVDTTFLMMKALEDGHQVFFPRVEQGLKFYEIQNRQQLQKGAWGVLEPTPECNPLQGELNLILVPGVVFDKKGFRIGYGKGFYDRLLFEFDCPKMAIAFEFQLVEEIPTEEWDQPVDLILTEKNEYEID